MSEERRKEIALALAQRDGHQPEDISDWRKTVYAQRADEVIGQEVGVFEDVPCPKCGGRGFTEEEHGLVAILCDCDKAREVTEILGMQEVTVSDPKRETEAFTLPEEEEREVPPPEITEGTDSEYGWEVKFEVADDSDSRTEPDNQSIGSDNTSQPKQPSKPKSKKKARKKFS